MGVKDLIRFMKKTSPTCFTTSFDQWKNNILPRTELKIAIDVPILAYRIAYKNGINQLHDEIIAFASRFKSTVGVPIFVFDGEKLKEKDEERAKRENARSIRAAKEEVNTIEKRSLFDGEEILVEITPQVFVPPRRQDYEKMIMTLTSLGYECKRSKYEAEALCAMLCRNGDVHAVITEDSDCFAYGCPNVILQFNPTLSNQNNALVVNFESVLSGLNLSPIQFIEFCVLLGNDFNDRIHLVGPVKSLHLIKSHENLNTILTELDANELQRERMQKSREIFLNFCYEKE
jgi:5'-3' exonuclease